VNRYATLYLVTLLVIVPLDFLFLGVVARDFFTSQVGNMLGEIKLVPAILFYLLYVVGIVIFVSAQAGASWPSTLLYGALFGLFCYATFDLTALSLLKHWSWEVAIVDISWGASVTAVASTAGGSRSVSMDSSIGSGARRARADSVLYGDAAVYCGRTEVAPLIERYRADPALFAEQSRRARSVVARAHDPALLVERIMEMLPVTGVAAPALTSA